MAGSRKFTMATISRDDVAALTPDAARITGLPYVMDADREEVEALFNGAERQRRGTPRAGRNGPERDPAVSEGSTRRAGCATLAPCGALTPRAGVAEWQTRGT
jgi:hypothetical protein